MNPKIYMHSGDLVPSEDGKRMLIRRMSPENLRMAKEFAEKEPPLYAKDPLFLALAKLRGA